MKSTASSVAEWRSFGGAKPPLQLALLAGRPLGVDEQTEAFLEAESGGLVGLERRARFDAFEADRGRRVQLSADLQQGIEFVKRFAPPDAQLTCRPILIHGQCFRGGPRKCARTTTERPVVERILPAKYTAVPQTLK